MLSVQKIIKQYIINRVPQVILADVSFSVSRGEIVAIIGRNGSGKTTLINIVHGSLKQDSGIVSVDGQALNRRRHRMVLVPQNPESLLVSNMTVLENWQLIRSHSTSFLFSFPALAPVSSLQTSEAGLDFQRLALHYVNELSGGQRQLLSLEIALARQPNVLLLDEFSANLDSSICEVSYSRIKNFVRDAQIPCVLVSHDQNCIGALADRSLHLVDGKISD